MGERAWLRLKCTWIYFLHCPGSNRVCYRDDQPYLWYDSRVPKKEHRRHGGELRKICQEQVVLLLTQVRSLDFMLFDFLAMKNSEKSNESTYLLCLGRMCLNPHFVLVTRLDVSQWQLQPMDWHWGSCWALLRWSPPATGGAHSLRRREPGVFYQSRVENQELLSVFQVITVLFSVEQLELKILKDRLCQE